MKVETYEVELKKHPEACEEAVALVKSLGLTGQESLLTPAASEVQTRTPYRKMRADEFQVFSVLCPAHTLVEQYKEQAIPLRVLQVLEHAKSLNYYTKFYVWHPVAPIKDPVLVGCPADSNQYDVSQYHILARWGEELDEMPALTRRAAEVHRLAVAEECKDAISRLQTRLALVQGMKSNDPAVLKVSMPTVYVN